MKENKLVELSMDFFTRLRQQKQIRFSLSIVLNLIFNRISLKL